MTGSNLKEQLLNLEMAGSKDRPKLHKPLLVALLLQRFIESGSTSASFSEIESQANELIRRFVEGSSPPRSQYPFWRLRQDGFWEIDGAEELELNSSGDPKITELRSPTHKGRWSESAIEELHKHGGESYLELVLQTYFPTNTEEVRDALGLRTGNVAVSIPASGGPSAGIAKSVEVTPIDVQEVPLEVVKRERAEFERANSGTATQREFGLTARFEAYLQAHGRDVRRYRISGVGSSALYSDLADVTENVLYEAKGSTDRMSIRLALGQILDYGRFVPSASLAVLLPDDTLGTDLVELLESHDVGCVVETEPNRFADLTQLGRCP